MTLTADAASRTVQTPDWSIHYHEAGAGRPVVLLHGSGPGATGWSNFAGNIAALAGSFRVIAPDMPGWGASDPCTVERLDHVDAAIQLLDVLGIEKAVFVGNSMGGATSLRRAAERPDRVSHLIAMGAPSDLRPKLFSPGDGPTEGLKALVAAYADPTPEAMRRLVEIMVFDKTYATDELCAARSEAAAAEPRHLANFLNGLPHGAPVPRFVRMDDLTSLTVPALLIHGRDDRVVPYEHSLHLLAHIPNARLVLLNRCGHWAMIEHADEFNRLVTEFITNN